MLGTQRFSRFASVFVFVFFKFFVSLFFDRLIGDMQYEELKAYPYLKTYIYIFIIS